MRAITAQWFECKVKYEKVMEDGLQKSVTEQYVVDAMSFAEAEKRICEEMSAYVNGAFEVTDVKKASYKEIIFADGDDAADRWYKVKLDFISFDEKTEKEKLTRVCYLVQAASLNGAMKATDEVMGTTMIDYEAAAVQDTKIIDVFAHVSNKNG